mmetsp:Transcript_4739/g.10461  ORF Transcript_4739/g.10461 Transcript_4739/m.10461 type:complete len:334 (-) Transcript_4739:1492-2493(-)
MSWPSLVDRPRLQWAQHHFRRVRHLWLGVAEGDGFCRPALQVLLHEAGLQLRCLCVVLPLGCGRGPIAAAARRRGAKGGDLSDNLCWLRHHLLGLHLRHRLRFDCLRLGWRWCLPLRRLRGWRHSIAALLRRRCRSSPRGQSPRGGSGAEHLPHELPARAEVVRRLWWSGSRHLQLLGSDAAMPRSSPELGRHLQWRPSHLSSFPHLWQRLAAGGGLRHRRLPLALLAARDKLRMLCVVLQLDAWLGGCAAASRRCDPEGAHLCHHLRRLWGHLPRLQLRCFLRLHRLLWGWHLLLRWTRCGRRPDSALLWRRQWRRGWRCLPTSPAGTAALH